MRRFISQHSPKVYDAVIIGAGIYGAWIARDAGLRGLSVALVDQGDFGSGTSSNSQRIAHGGFRYLQHGDFRRMRDSIRERSNLMRVAPHLVFPMPVVIPTYRNTLQGKIIMRVALKVNDLIGFDRNRELDSEKNIPSGRILSKNQCVAFCPDLQRPDLTGAALFFDGQIHNTERLILSILRSAERSGVDLANYAQVVGFLRTAEAIVGVSIQDLLSGRLVEIRARTVVNCTGPWTDLAVEMAGIKRSRNKMRWVKAALLLTRKLFPNVAVGIKGCFRYKNADTILDKGHRYFFITPWKNNSLIGTFEAPYDGDADGVTVSEDEIGLFIEQVNAAYPAGRLSRADVRLVYRGLVPASDQGENPGGQPAKRYEIWDHSVSDGVQGLISVIGVKYTTARHVAQKSVDLIEFKLGRRPTASRTAFVPVYGGSMNSIEKFLASELRKKTLKLADETYRHLIECYGSEYHEVLRYCEADSKWCKPVISSSPVIRAEILHAIREEMACKLEDLIVRRTELGSSGYSDEACVGVCADIMSTELKSNRGLNRPEASAPV